MSYEVETPPDDPTLLKEYLQKELGRVSAAIKAEELDVIAFKVWHETPPKLREGDFFYGALDVGITGAAGLRIVDDTGIRLVNVT